MTLKVEKSKDIDRVSGDTAELETSWYELENSNLDMKQSKGNNEMQDWVGLDLNRLLYEMSVEVDPEIIALSVFDKTAGCAIAFVGASSFIGKYSFLIIGIW